MSEVERPIVIVSNRGPVTFEIDSNSEGSGVVARRGSGGLVSGLAPLLDSGRATWVAAALSEGDRLAASSKAVESSPSTGAEAHVELISIDEHELGLYYDVISNETLWFIHHGLFDLVRSPSFGPRWWDAWDAYEHVNDLFAERVASVAPERAVVLIQDYHLSIAGDALRRKRPDLSLVHFLHTPFAGPDNLRVLPGRARSRMLWALASHDACGFHTRFWAQNFSQCMDSFPAENRATPRIFTSTLSSDVNDILATASSSECVHEVERISDLVDGRRLIVRVDRMELSKNIVRGFEAFDLLLRERSDLRGSVVFLACCYPSRENIPAYARYRAEVEEAAERINNTWASGNWTPVLLETDDSYPRSVAALSLYDTLLVNPIRDGLNLVAKEGPVVNRRSGQLVLSTQAGAWTELGDHAFGVNPFDISDTARALGEALDANDPMREDRATRLRIAASSRTPADWLDDQLAAAGSLTS